MALGASLTVVLRGAAGIHAELAVGRSVEHLRGIGQEGVGHPHLGEHALDDAEVARVGSKPGTMLSFLFEPTCLPSMALRVK